MRSRSTFGRSGLICFSQAFVVCVLSLTQSVLPCLCSLFARSFLTAVFMCFQFLFHVFSDSWLTCHFHVSPSFWNRGKIDYEDRLGEPVYDWTGESRFTPSLWHQCRCSIRYEALDHLHFVAVNLHMWLSALLLLIDMCFFLTFRLSP